MRVSLRIRAVPAVFLYEDCAAHASAINASHAT